MRLKLTVITLVICTTLQAVSVEGNDLVAFEKFDYLNQSMEELGFPEDNYSPSNFYTLSIVNQQRLNVSEQVAAVVADKTAGLFSFHCMTKDFRNCKVDFDAFDSLGNLVYSERGSESGTYKVRYHAPGEYKISFYNGEVAPCY